MPYACECYWWISFICKCNVLVLFFELMCKAHRNNLLAITCAYLFSPRCVIKVSCACKRSKKSNLHWHKLPTATENTMCWKICWEINALQQGRGWRQIAESEYLHFIHWDTQEISRNQTNILFGFFSPNHNIFSNKSLTTPRPSIQFQKKEIWKAWKTARQCRSRTVVEELCIFSLPFYFQKWTFLSKERCIRQAGAIHKDTAAARWTILDKKGQKVGKCSKTEWEHE